jgi:hypothetical protein
MLLLPAQVLRCGCIARRPPCSLAAPVCSRNQQISGYKYPGLLHRRECIERAEVLNLNATWRPIFDCTTICFHPYSHQRCINSVRLAERERPLVCRKLTVTFAMTEFNLNRCQLTTRTAPLDSIEKHPTRPTIATHLLHGSAWAAGVPQPYQAIKPAWLPAVSLCESMQNDSTSQCK